MMNDKEELKLPRALDELADAYRSIEVPPYLAGRITAACAFERERPRFGWMSLLSGGLAVIFALVIAQSGLFSSGTRGGAFSLAMTHHAIPSLSEASMPTLTEVATDFVYPSLPERSDLVVPALAEIEAPSMLGV